MKRSDPFTRTPGIAGDAFIDMHYADKITDEFKSVSSHKYVYKIVGLRGSGKSVEYGKILSEMRLEKDWLVYTLSAAGNPIETLLAMLSKESFADGKIHKITHITSGAAEANAVVAKGSMSYSSSKITEDNPLFFSPEASIKDMLRKAKAEGYKVLVGIDDISKTTEMVKFLSLWGELILDQSTDMYMLCTGLYQNIEDFAKEPSLTFFKRGDVIEINGLDLHSIAAMYYGLLGVSREESVKLAKFTKGYAYAYQVLGSLYFNQPEPKSLEALMPEFDRVLFRDSYDLIWTSLTEAERDFVKYIIQTNGKASEIKKLMTHESGYSSLRARLENKHLINTEDRGVIKIDLPRFKEYIELWHLN